MFIKNQKNSPKLFGILFFLFISAFLISLQTINTQTQEESLRIRFLLDIIPRFQGRTYSNKIDIKFDNNDFVCNVNSSITPKEFSFLSNNGYAICSDRIFENFGVLAKFINNEINQNLDPKLFANVKFMNDFKQTLYFAYYLTYIDYTNQKEKYETPKDKFFDSNKLSHTQREILDNLNTQNFSIFDLTNEDVKILNNYLHTIVDFDLIKAKENINKIIMNIEKTLSKSSGFRDWISSNNKRSVKFFLPIVWKYAIHLGFE